MSDEKISMSPVKKQSLYLKISDSIYTYIQLNKLQPGDKLPSERKMSEMLQTSRNSVREALRILEDRGLIEVKTGRGVFLKNPYGGTSTFSIQLKNCTNDEIHELQTLLDHQAVINAVNRATADERDEIVTIANDMIKLASNDVYSHVLDYKFHSSLYRSAGNTAISQLIMKIREDRFVQQADSQCGNDAIWLKTIPQHLTLAQAIKAQDVDQAIRAIDEINEFGYQVEKQSALT